MIYDCFQFFNEIDILFMRMNILKDVVNKFVVSESTVTFSGVKKPLYFEMNREKFKDFSDMIIYQVVEDTPDVNPFERDSFQKKAVKRALKDCKEDDIIIFSDVDEIPNPQKIEECLKNFDKQRVYHFAQRNFYCYLNMEEKDGKLLSFTGEFPGIEKKKWLGSKMCSYAYIKDRTLEELRFPDKIKEGIRIDDGGWHFSYMGRTKDEKVVASVSKKIKSAAHQEFNNVKVLMKLSKNIKKGEDLFGRGAKFEIVPIDATFPEYLRDNLEMYNHLIKQ